MASGLFGSKKKPMFGNPAERYGTPQATPGIGDGMTRPMPMGQGMPVNQPGQKTGLGTRLFGQGWEDKAFALGGIMQGDPSGVYMMRQDERAQQQAAQAASMAELKRAQELADYEYKKGIDQKYEGPPSIIKNADAIGAELGPEARQDYLRNYGRAPVQPNVVNIPGLGTFYGTPEEVTAAIQAARSGGGAPQGKPYDPNEWDVVEGGPTASQSGNFRP